MIKKPTTNQSIPQTPDERESLRSAIADYASQHRLVPPLSMEELRDHATLLAPHPDLVDYAMVLLNNVVWTETVASIPYERRLLLLPQCLRDSRNCPATIDEFGLLCEECGRCAIGELQAAAEELGYVVLVAEGSTVVSKLLEGGKVDAVIGVSCLHALEKSFPHMADGAIPGLAIPLNDGGCIDTTTDVEQVRQAIRLKSDTPWINRVDTARIRPIVEGWFDSIDPASAATRTEQIACEWLCKEGKRWRPFLLACTYDALCETHSEFPEDVRRLALAVECFHKASLVHDDIEDDDDFRYDAPTLHRQHGIPVALNVGDLLVGEGYRWIAETENHTAELFHIAVENHRALCLGQGEELIGLDASLPFSTGQIIEIFRHKTAPAFRASLQLGAVAAGGGLGMMIPPSVVFIVYAILTEQSIGTLFIAGITPGLLIAALFCVTVYIQCKINPKLGPAGPKMSWGSKFASLSGLIETLILFAGVMGGMFAGYFTPTEAAAIGAAGSLIIAAARGQLSRKMLTRSLMETLRTSCMVMIIVCGAMIFGRFLAITRIPFELATWLAGLPLPGWMVIGMIILFYLAAGCFIDALALAMLTIPIFYPVVMELGFDPIWFGVMIVLVTQMGVITPPVGVNVYVISGVERDVPLQTIFRGAMPFLLALIVAAILLVLFPSICTFLPNRIG